MTTEYKDIKYIYKYTKNLLIFYILVVGTIGFFFEGFRSMLWIGINGLLITFLFENIVLRNNLKYRDSKIKRLKKELAKINKKYKALRRLDQ